MNMKQLMPITEKRKQIRLWPEAYKAYQWGHGIEGICVDYNLIQIAEMAGKDMQFFIQRRKNSYRIDPEYAKIVVAEHKSVYTSKRSRRPVAVIPISACTEL